MALTLEKNECMLVSCHTQASSRNITPLLDSSQGFPALLISIPAWNFQGQRKQGVLFHSLLVVQGGGFYWWWWCFLFFSSKSVKTIYQIEKPVGRRLLPRSLL